MQAHRAALQSYADARLSPQQGRALWRAMRAELAERGLFAPSLARSLIKLASLLVLLAAALGLAWLADSVLELAVACCALALILAQLAFIGHDAGHGSLAPTRVLNRAFGQIAMTVVTGLAFDEWIARHRMHHRYCQDASRDPDMAVTWVASLTLESVRDKGALGRFMTRHQALHVWLLALLFGHSQRHLSQLGAWKDLRRRRLDASMLLAHLALWFGVPSVLLGVPPLTALLVYLVPVTLLGPYLAAIFWINHVGMPLIGRATSFSFVEHQVVTSRTVESPRGLGFLFGGLNLQVEHHLFPGVPSHRLIAAQTTVRSHLERCGVGYRAMPWPAAVREVATHLYRVARSV